MLRAASSGRLSSRVCIAGSSRLRSRSCSARHSGKVAGEDAGGVELLQPAEHRLDPRRVRSRGAAPRRRAHRRDSRSRRAGRAGAGRSAGRPGRSRSVPICSITCSRKVRGRAAVCSSPGRSSSPSVPLRLRQDCGSPPRSTEPSPSAPAAACQCSAASGAKLPSSVSGRAVGTASSPPPSAAAGGRPASAVALAPFEQRVLLDFGIDEIGQLEVR